MKKLALFAGTTEGKKLTEWLIAASESDRPHADFFADVFVATEYGHECLPENDRVRVYDGRLKEQAMLDRFSSEEYDLVVDATHPYAAEVSRIIETVCETLKISRIRVRRDEECTESCAFLAESTEEAVDFLKRTEGNILVTTGSKELAKFLALPDWGTRVYARVLSLPSVVEACDALGFRGAHLIAMQGPFSAELNEAMLRSVGARWLVTKESGREGGFSEKAMAAARAGAALVVIGRPADSGISLAETIGRISEFLGLGEGGPDSFDKKASEAPYVRTVGREIAIIGAGPGNPELLTGEARHALKSCDVIIGARRPVRQLEEFHKPVYEEYAAEKIVSFILEHPEYRRIAAVVSGDPGFYSGARALCEQTKCLPDTAVRLLPGISSMNYFFSRIGRPWEDVRLVSMHGREAFFEDDLRQYGKVFLLAGARDALREICRRLLEAGLSDTRVTVAENLSLPNERIRSGTPKELASCEAESLTVVFLERIEPFAQKDVPERPEESVKSAESADITDTEQRPRTRLFTPGLPDDAFIRAEVPMTKQEVRAVSLAKLRLTEGAIVYDIGAGTGSVSVECASLSDTIQVYAVERKPEAVELLLKNREKFGLPNLKIIEGAAPEALSELPAPTHVFIGGSGGELPQVIRTVLRKNPEAVFVINAIMPETLASLLSCVKEEAAADFELVQLSASRSRKIGPGHLMTAQNPVWIASFRGNGESRDGSLG